jgi:nitrite reductase/ring-hydroxylating ferredoxin subunit
VSGYQDLASVDDVPDGEMFGAELANGDPVCIYNYEGTIGAVGDMCTHALFRLHGGVLRPDGTIECLWHGARYDCRTGDVKRHPAVAPIPVYEVRVEEGRVLVGPKIVRTDGW